MRKHKLAKSKLNVLTTLMKQVVATLCGILLPRILIGSFGSAVYGTTTSIAQFLSYISLLEGGIGQVARGALYKPLAAGDREQISRIHLAIHRFFLKIAGIFLVYTLIVAVFYHDISRVTVFDRSFTFWLVIAVSLATMSNYLGGYADLTLMNADQKQYLTNFVFTFTNVFTMILVIILVHYGANIIMVKLASASVFIIRRACYAGYVRGHYRLPKVRLQGDELEQKWTGMGQHFAYFLHTNIDVILLTLFSDVKLVAVYTVYHLVIRSIWDISSAFSGGMEAAFGELIAKKKTDALNQAYRKYTIVLTMVALILFGCTGVLIVPFVRLYMQGITDVNYIQPVFALLLLLAEAMNCLALPYTTLPISANQLKQSRWGSYGEAIINIVLSLILIQWNPLIGIAIGTLTATLFKSLYYIFFTAKHILRCRPGQITGMFFGALILLVTVSCCGMTFFENMFIPNFFLWGLWGFVVFALVSAIVFLFGMIVYHQEMKSLIGNFIHGGRISFQQKKKS